jgi:hypothetical protein
MRTQFVACKTRRTAVRRCPWAALIIKVQGGYQCFESVEDHRIWHNQR